MSRPMGQGLFHFVMIKPSRYDDDGYPLQWIRSAIPSNTLACVYALADDARRRAVLGAQVEIRLHAYDETNRRVRPERIIRMIRKSGGRALIGFIGVQSISALRRSGAPLRSGGPSGLHWRFPRVRLHCHAAGAAKRAQGCTSDGHLLLCRRMRRA
jgi:hypothetical protein